MVNGKVERGRGGQQQRDQRAVEADADLEPSVRTDEVPDLGRPPAQEKASHGESRHEGGQDRGDRIDRMTEDETQHPEPHDLVHESEGARDEEKREEQHPVWERSSRAFDRKTHVWILSPRRNGQTIARGAQLWRVKLPPYGGREVLKGESKRARGRALALFAVVFLFDF